jgi:hypothetical protein
MRDRDIAVPVDCHREVVSKWRRGFCEQRIEGSKDKPRAGRPRRSPWSGSSRSACELPIAQGGPLGRCTHSETHRLVVDRAITDASATTICP